MPLVSHTQCTSSLIPWPASAINDTICAAIGLRVGTTTGQPHNYELCGKDADPFGHHGLSLKSSLGHIFCHNALNNIILHSLVAARIASHLELINGTPSYRQ